MRERAKKIAIGTGISTFSLFFLLFGTANATVLIGQTNNSGVCNITTCGNQFTLISYTNATSTVQAIQFWASGNSGDTYLFTLGGTSGTICSISGTLSTTTSGEYITQNCASGSNPANSLTAGNYGFYSGYQANPITAGTNGLPNLGGFNYYFEAFDSSGNTGTNTGFIGTYTPTNGAYSTTSPTTFSAYYYFNCNTSFGQYDTLTFSIQDLTNPTQSPYVSPQPLGICGQGLLTATVSLNTGDSYLWRPEMYLSGTSSVPLYGDTYFFQSTITPGIDINNAVGASVGTSTLPSTTNLLTFLNVPNLLETKFPFAYIFQIASGIQIAISTTTYNSIPSGNFVWSGIGTGTTTFDFFSTTTIGYYLSPTLIGVWRGFLVIVLYVSFGYALYETARKHLSL